MERVQAHDYPRIEYAKRIGIYEKFLRRLMLLKGRHKDKAGQCLHHFHPEIATKLEFFDQKAGKSKSNYEQRLCEILQALQDIRPARICEMGSGRSSLIFSVWAERQAIEYTAYEQLEFWADVSNQATQAFSSKKHVEFCEIQDVERLGARFVKDIPPDTDFIYVDGPTLSECKGCVTYSGKAAFTDVPDFIRRGGKPKLIMVEGRTATVDLILAEAKKSGLKFKFLPSFYWALQRARYKDALACRLHSYLYFQ